MTHTIFFLLTFLIVSWLKSLSFFKELENHFCTSYLPAKIICCNTHIFCDIITGEAVEIKQEPGVGADQDIRLPEGKALTKVLNSQVR